jgi:hypothetical protein
MEKCIRLQEEPRLQVLRRVLDEIIGAMPEAAYDRPEDLVWNSAEVWILEEEYRRVNKIVVLSTAENQQVHQGVSPKANQIHASWVNPRLRVENVLPSTLMTDRHLDRSSGLSRKPVCQLGEPHLGATTDYIGSVFFPHLMYFRTHEKLMNEEVV